MKTCETCEHWSKMFERCKRDNGKTHIDCCDKDFGCIHHEEKKEPEVTVDEAINWCKDWRKWNINSAKKETQSSKYVGFAIRALEEMREREKALKEWQEDPGNIIKKWDRCFQEVHKDTLKIPKPLTDHDFNTSDLNKTLREILDGFPCKGDGTEYQMIYKGKDYYINIHVGKGPIQLLKRTWMDVTAGELVDELNQKGWEGDACDVKQTAEYLAERKASRDRADK